MKKYLTLLLTLVFCLTLVSCGNKGGGNTVGGKITLTYAGWSDAEIDEKLFAEFTKLYPNVTVIKDTTIAGTGNQFTQNLVTASQSGTLPDVFITDSVPSMIEHGLVSDISEYWDKDEDAKLVYDSIKGTALYNGKRLAMPSFQFIKGMLVNKTLLEDIGAEIPEYDWTFDEFKEYCETYKGLTRENGHIVQGVNGFSPNGGAATLDFESVMIPQDSDTLGYNTWDGSKFNYTDPLWIKYRAETKYFHDNGLLEQMTEEEKNTIYGKSDAYVFEEGDVMFGIEGSWNAETVINNFSNNGITVDFYPFPAGKTQRIPSIIDFICVSSQSANKEMAYELAKFMSFGRKGMQARITATKELNKVMNGFPVADYPEIWSEIIESINEARYPGIRENVRLLSIGACSPDCDKWVPGYGSFWVWVAENAETQGFYEMPVDQLATVWNEALNKQIKDAYTTLGLN